MGGIQGSLLHVYSDSHKGEPYHIYDMISLFGGLSETRSLRFGGCFLLRTYLTSLLSLIQTAHGYF